MRATDHTMPKTIGELMGGDTDKPFELNRAESAVCPHCGLEPKLHTEKMPSGRDLIAWLPVKHACRGRSQ